MRAILDPIAGVLAPRAPWASTRILKEATIAVRVPMADLLSRRRVSCAQIPPVKLVLQTPPPTRGAQGSVTAHARRGFTVTPASVWRALYVRLVPMVRSLRVLEPTACVIKDSMEIQDKASHVEPALRTRRHDRMCRVRASFKTARAMLGTTEARRFSATRPAKHAQTARTMLFRDYLHFQIAQRVLHTRLPLQPALGAAAVFA